MLSEEKGVMLPEPAPVRIKFTKTGMLKFISHLDLVRTMKSALLRAGIPVWYTEGFNPHPKMVFAMSLSLGAQSLCEFMDIKLTRAMTHDEIAKRLNSALAEGLRVTEVYTPVMKFTAAAWASYTVSCAAPVNISVLNAPVLNVMKRTKSGERETDIRPLIKSAELMPDGSLALTLRADNVNFLNPDLVMRTLGADDYQVMRTGVFTEDGITPFV